MTNKELLDEISGEMKDLHDEREKELEEVEKSEYPDGLKKQMKKYIMDNFYEKMEGFKKRPGYDAAIKSARHEGSLRGKLKKIEKQRDKIQKEYEIAQIAHRGKVEDEEKAKSGKEKLIGNTDAILNDLRENHVKIEENAEVEGYKGKKVHINLPAVGNFEGFKFDYFVSNDCVYKKDFEAKYELKKKSYSMSDVSKLLQAMNEYMTELGGNNDGNIDYETELKCWETKKNRCTAGDCLKAITGLKYWYWLSDKDVAGRMDSRAGWRCNGAHCDFFRNDNNYNYANLFLRLSD